MNAPRGNGAPLREYKRNSHQETRAALLEAIAHFRDGDTRRVAPGTKMTVSSVAREADIHRTTLHGYHADIVELIHGLKDEGTGEDPEAKCSAPPEVRRKLKELRAIIEQLQRDKEQLAQHNYALRRENEALNTKLARRDQMYRELTRARNVGTAATYTETPREKGRGERKS